MRFDSVYEGCAQVVTPLPLTVRYRKADGTVVARQVALKSEKMVPVGTFVKIVVEDEVSDYKWSGNFCLIAKEQVTWPEMYGGYR